MVALNYARDVRIGDRPVAGVMLGDKQIWPAWPVDMFYLGQSLNFDFINQRYGTKSLVDGSVGYTTNVNDLGILTRASTGTYWGPSGTLLEAAVDEARIQHDPVTGEALGLLVESSATNSLINSNNPSLFTHVGADISLVQGEGLEWVISSTSAGTGSGYLYQSEGRNPVDGRTCSVWFKQGTSRYGVFTVQAGGVFAPDNNKYTTVVADFLDESLSLIDRDNAFSLGAESYIGAGYCKIVLSGRNLTSIQDSRFCIAPSDIPVVHAYRATSAGGGIIYIGGQVDLGSGATSYIPTTDSPVTRAADNCTIDIGEAFNPDEGTLRITAQVPEGGVVATLGDRHVISDSSEFKEYDLNYIFHSGNTVAQLGEGIFSKAEYFPAMQGESDLGDLIRTLYGNGEQGVMYIPEPKVLGQQVLWQDAAGTVPVTADGDPVGLMLDLSGNGNHATQPVSAERPVYRTDGVRHWLQGDGIDDYLTTQPTDSLATDSAGISMAMAARRTGSEALRVSQYGISDSKRVWNTRINATTPDSYSWGAQLNTTFNNNQPARIATSQNVTHTMSGRWQGAGSKNEARLNGGDWVLGEAALASSGVIVQQPIEVFSDDLGARPVSGDFFGIIVRRGFFSDDIHDTVENYLATIAGVQL